MNREDIIRMAREAGLTVNPPSWGYTEHYHFAGFEQPFERFFQAAYAAGAAAEREACAQVCEANVYEGYVPPEDGAAASYWDNSAIECAAAIRARGNT